MINTIMYKKIRGQDLRLSGRKLSVICMTVCVMLCAACFSACQSSADVIPGKYTVQNREIVIPPSLELNPDGSFVLDYSILSSRISMGDYAVSGNTLTLTDCSGDVYIFSVRDGALIFRQEASSDLPHYSDNDLSDGDVFLLTVKEENIS